jgi:hypothetical protein
VHTLTLSLLAVGLVACRPTHGQIHPTPLDSASAVRLAIAAVADTSDTLVFYAVAEFAHDKHGYVISIVPRFKSEYAGPRPDGTRLVGSGGGGRVHIGNNGKIKLIEAFL